MVAEIFSAPVRAAPAPRVERVSPRAEAREAARYDSVLVDRFTSGDAAAFDEIIARYREKLAAFAFTVLHNHADAEEIAQDALISAHRNLRRFRGDCKLASWLYTITLNATNYNGTVTEKYDVVRASHEVFAEYGNVGTKFSYITREGFGWTNASYQVGLGLLSPELRAQLNRLIPPEGIFSQVY